MATIPIRVRVTGTERQQRRFTAAIQIVDDELRNALKELGDTAELIFASYALHRTGRMARGIVSRAFGDRVIVEAHARNPETGYDYVGVTRFGHKVSIIRPKRAKALRIPLAGGTIFRKFSRGFHPATDWAEDALPEIETEAEAVAFRLGKTLEARI
jgi:hypothetical protein